MLAYLTNGNSHRHFVSPAFSSLDKFSSPTLGMGSRLLRKHFWYNESPLWRRNGVSYGVPLARRSVKSSTRKVTEHKRKVRTAVGGQGPAAASKPKKRKGLSYEARPSIPIWLFLVAMVSGEQVYNCNMYAWDYE
jgi:hypothetical protein